jgi:hypothetical protein
MLSFSIFLSLLYGRYYNWNYPYPSSEWRQVRSGSIYFGIPQEYFYSRIETH